MKMKIDDFTFLETKMEKENRQFCPIFNCHFNLKIEMTFDTRIHRADIKKLVVLVVLIFFMNTLCMNSLLVF